MPGVGVCEDGAEDFTPATSHFASNLKIRQQTLHFGGAASVTRRAGSPGPMKKEVRLWKNGQRSGANALPPTRQRLLQPLPNRARRISRDSTSMVGRAVRMRELAWAWETTISRTDWTKAFLLALADLPAKRSCRGSVAQQSAENEACRGSPQHGEAWCDRPPAFQPNGRDNATGAMTSTKQQDQRLLSKGERELIAATRAPAMKALSDRALADLAKHLRTARDRAGLLGRFQRRELRGQMPTSGVSASHSGTPSARRSLLAAAVTRVNREIERRSAVKAQSAPAAGTRRTSSRDHAVESGTRRTAPARPAIGDMQPVPNSDIPPLRRRGVAPVLERSRTPR